MKSSLSVLSFLLIGNLAYSQVNLKLTLEGPETHNGLEGTEEYITKKGHITNVTVPQLMLYDLPDKAEAKTAILLVPGGSYKGVAIEYEGYKSVEWLNSNGIPAAILKYRMPNGHPEVPEQDIAAAMTSMKKWAAERGVEKIGIMGFSAGGHLASMAITILPENLRPDFAVLIYPVISMRYNNASTGLNLIGPDPSEELIDRYSMDKNVDAHTPPTYIVLTADDKAVNPENSMLFSNALIKNSVPLQVSVFPEGNHGWWMRDRYKYGDQTYDSILKWINSFTVR